nr:hypothetical protein [Tanacetum cinerariifolium]
MFRPKRYEIARIVPVGNLWCKYRPCSVPINVTDLPTTYLNHSGLILWGPTSYAKLVNGEPSRKSVNFGTLITPAGNGVDVAVSLEYIGAFIFKDGLDAMLENGPWFIRNNLLISKKWNPDVNFLKEDVGNISVWVKLYDVPIAMIELRSVVKLKDNIMVDMPKLVGDWFYMCTIRVEYEWKPPSSSGKNKSAAIASKKLSNSNTFDVHNSVEKYDELSTNMGHLKSAGKGPNSDMFLSKHGFLNVESSCASTAHIVERIDKVERQIIDEKLTLVDDDGKPLPKVVSTKNIDSNSKMEDVVDDHTVFMASISLKRDADSG